MLPQIESLKDLPFTPAAREVLYDAQRTAYDLHLDAFTPEHLLYGLVINPVGKPLYDIGLNPKVVRPFTRVRSTGSERPITPHEICPTQSSEVVIIKGLAEMHEARRTDFRASDFFMGMVDRPEISRFDWKVCEVTPERWVELKVLERMDQLEREEQIRNLEESRLRGLPLDLDQYLARFDQQQLAVLLLNRIMDLEAKFKSL